jgi:iron complex transport system substrate-binding protein
MNTRRIFLPQPALVLALAATVFSACGKPVEKAADQAVVAHVPEYTLTDGAGRTVTLPARPQRIISISPAATDILTAENASAQMVGATRYCVISAAAAAHITRIGGMVDPDYERIVALKPDLVIIPWLADKTLQEKLTSLGLPVLVLHPESLAGVLAELRLVGQATGHAAEGAARAKNIESIGALTAARWKDVPPAKRPGVLICMDDISPAPGSYVDDVLTAAGGRNVLPREDKVWLEVPPERALQLAPDIVIEIPSASSTPGAMKKAALFPSAKVITMADPAPFYHPGPGVGAALWMLARAIAPARFPEAQPPVSSP